jgi:hypothetical protein
MEVKEVIRRAKEWVADIYSDEGIMNLGLEEIEFDDTAGLWRVTLGFSRPWNSVRGALAAIGGDVAARRAYRVVSIREPNGEVVSVKRRDAVGD